MNGFLPLTLRRVLLLLAVLTMVALLGACAEEDDDDDDDNATTTTASSETNDEAEDTEILAKCPDGTGANAGVICYAIDDGDQTTRTTEVDGDAFTVQYDTADEELTIQTNMSNTVENPDIGLVIKATATGTYTYSDETAELSYYLGSNSSTYDSIWLVDTSSCDAGTTSASVKIEEYGAVGEAIKGTFTATTVEYDFDGSKGIPHKVYCDTTATVKGAFNVTRSADTSGD